MRRRAQACGSKAELKLAWVSTHCTEFNGIQLFARQTFYYRTSIAVVGALQHNDRQAGSGPICI